MDEFLAALESIDSEGSFYTEKKINADKLTIKVNKVGDLQFPISTDQIHKLIKIAKPASFGWKDQTIKDENVRKVWKIAKSYTRVVRKQWEKVIIPVLEEIKQDLGLPSKSKLTAEFHDLLVYEPGCFFKSHQDSEKADGMIATMVIVLPTEYEGGDLVVKHQGEEKRLTSRKYKIPKHQIAAFYADCLHEITPVNSGYRVALTYNLILNGYKGNVSEFRNKDFSSRLRNAVDNYFNQPVSERVPKVIYLLDHQYTQAGISWQHLKNSDHVRVNELLKIADKIDLDAHLVLADVKEMWDCEYDYDSYRYNRYRYDDDDEDTANPTYLLDTEITLKHWLDRKGNKFDLQSFIPRSSEICWTSDNEDFSPYESEYEGWTGNYGNTLDRWYHRAALVLWKKQDYFAVLFEIDPSKFVDEIFGLTNDANNKPKVVEMLQHASKYWERYATRHKEPNKISNVLKLCLYLNDPLISDNLLSAYNLEIFNCDNIIAWKQLVKMYNYEWFVTIFEKWIDSSKKYYYSNLATIKNLDDIVDGLLSKKPDKALVDYLLAYQYRAIKDQHTTKEINPSYIKKSQTRADDISVLLGTMARTDYDQLKMTIEEIQLEPDRYPPLEMAIALCQSADKYLKNTETVNAFREYLLANLKKEYKNGLRAEDDWSIQAQSSCRCNDCETLNQFLQNSTDDKTLLAINEARRQHVVGKLEPLCVPVKYSTQKTGTPYKLVLQKTAYLYKDAETRYQKIKTSIARLESQLSCHALT